MLLCCLYRTLRIRLVAERQTGSGVSWTPQALPIFIDRLADPITAVLVSIVVVLVFGEPTSTSG